MTPAVSVITIFLNAEPYLTEAIESVLAQSFEDWELLLIDDGSTDGSTTQARRYAQRHSDRIRYLEHPGHLNRGTSAARNLGIRHARGEWIACLDADDVWLPNKLEHQMRLVGMHPKAGMFCGASLYWHSWTRQRKDKACDRVVPVGGPQDTLLRPPAPLMLLYPLGNGSAPCVSSLFVHRQVVETVGGFEESFRGILQLYEDQAFLAKVYLRTPVFISSTCCDRYRQHATSCVSKVAGGGHYHTVREHFLAWFEGYLRTQGETDGEVWRALRRALMPYRHPARFLLVRLRQAPVKLLKRLLSAIGLRS